MPKNVLTKWREHIGMATKEILEFFEARDWSVELFETNGHFTATVFDHDTVVAEGNGKQASVAIQSAFSSWKKNGQPIKA